MRAVRGNPCGAQVRMHLLADLLPARLLFEHLVRQAVHLSVEYRVLSAHLPKWRPAGVIDTGRLQRALRHP
ncbi:hypothetical protein [Streptomyces aureus]|uniref:hypothetical protein n=1 Tax=Streptomyces aureus TaxID=193461 RepID=UPI00362E4B25